MKNTAGSTTVSHILSVDVEEYFQIEGANLSVDEQSTWPRRLHVGVDKILQTLDDHHASATFFILGWVAKNEPDIVKQIADAGHEIGSHGLRHVMLTHLTPNSFRDDLIESRQRLEDLTGQNITGFRAPTFSIMHTTAWAIDVLAECGFEYDSSVFPVRHDRYGVVDAPRWIHRAQGPSGNTIIEIPPLTRRVCGMNLAMGGGGYLRLLPVSIIAGAVDKAQRQNHPAMIYVHPWEFDPDQPKLPVSALTAWRQRQGLKRTEDKLSHLLKRFKLTSVRNVLNAGVDDDIETFRYGITPSIASPARSEQT